jgi:hypothetical protein
MLNMVAWCLVVEINNHLKSSDLGDMLIWNY